MFRFYGFGRFQDVLQLRLKQFWFLSRQIDRLAAEEDQRAAHVLMAMQSGDAARQFFADRRKIMGNIVEYDEAQKAQKAEYDRAGLLALKGRGVTRG